MPTEAQLDATVACRADAQLLYHRVRPRHLFAHERLHRMREFRNALARVRLHDDLRVGIGHFLDVVDQREALMRTADGKCRVLYPRQCGEKLAQAQGVVVCPADIAPFGLPHIDEHHGGVRGGKEAGLDQGEPPQRCSKQQQRHTQREPAMTHRGGEQRAEQKKASGVVRRLGGLWLQLRHITERQRRQHGRGHDCRDP